MEKDNKLDNLDSEIRKRLNKTIEKREPSVKQTKTDVTVMSDNTYAQGKIVRLPSSSDTQDVGMINRWRARQLESNNNLEAAKVIFDTELAQLKHQAEAAVLESKTFWTGKSAEITELIKNYLQDALGNIEISRMETTNRLLKKATEQATRQLIEIQSSDLPQVMKDLLTDDIVKGLENTKDRIRSNELGKKYSLD